MSKAAFGLPAGTASSLIAVMLTVAVLVMVLLKIPVPDQLWEAFKQIISVYFVLRAAQWQSTRPPTPGG